MIPVPAMLHRDMAVILDPLLGLDGYIDLQNLASALNLSPESVQHRAWGQLFLRRISPPI